MEGRKEGEAGCEERGQFSPPKVLAVLDTAEEDDTSEGVEEHEQEHSHDDEEGLEHRHHNCQHQHLQGGLAMVTQHVTCGRLLHTIHDNWLIPVLHHKFTNNGNPLK